MSRPPACRLRRGKAAASLGRLSFYPIPSGCAFLMVVALSHVGATLPASEGSEPAIAGFRQDGGVFATGGLEIPADLRETPARLWRRSIDPGHSTPMIVDDLLVFTTFNEATKQLATVALDKRTGGERWRRVAPAERLEQYHRVGSPAACSVASDGRRVVAFFGSYGMVCYDRLGKEQWKRPFGPFQDEFGTGSSPIASHGRVFLNEDHDTDNFLCALDVATGRTLWQADRNQFTRSYATPLLLEVEGRWQVIVPGALTITAYDAQTGERIWWVHGLARIVNTVPVYRDGVLFVSTWAPGGDVGQRIAMESWAEAIGRYDANGDGLIRREELRDGPVLTRFFRIDINQDGGLDKQEWQKHAVVFQRARNGTMAIALPAQGDVTETHVLWRTDRGAPYVASPVVYQGIVYLVKDSGILTALDASTGQVLKQGRLKGRGNYYSSPVVVDSKLYAASEPGVVTVVDVQERPTVGNQWPILAWHDFQEPIYATPQIDGGRMYVRTGSAIYAFGRNTEGEQLRK